MQISRCDEPEALYLIHTRFQPGDQSLTHFSDNRFQRFTLPLSKTETVENGSRNKQGLNHPVETG